MSSGPCLCGDPACSRCFPSTARYALNEQAIADIVDEMGLLWDEACTEWDERQEHDEAWNDQKLDTLRDDQL